MDFQEQIPSKYKKLEILGEGLSSQVYLVCKRDEFAHKYAIKFLKNMEFESNFIGEFQQLAKMRSRYFPRSYSLDYVNGVLLQVQEYIKGISLRELIDYGISEKEAWHIIYQINEAIGDLRFYTYVHGDISLDNILIDMDGNLVLIDMAAAGKVFQYSEGFCCPEVLRKQEYSMEGDLYSLGVVFSKLIDFLSESHKKQELMKYMEQLLQISPKKRLFRVYFGKPQFRRKSSIKINKKKSASLETVYIVQKKRYKFMFYLLLTLLSFLSISDNYFGNDSNMFYQKKNFNTALPDYLQDLD